MPYSPPFKPRAHQIEALQKSSGKTAFAYLMEMGTGKTKVGYDEFGTYELAGEVSDMCIFAPAGGYLNWGIDEDGGVGGEFLKHASEDLRERAVVMPWISGAGRNHMRNLEQFLRLRDPRRPRILLVNTEAMSTVQKARDLVRQLMETSSRGVLCTVDESTAIKNWESKRTRFITELGRKAKYRRIMSGLVAPRDPLDLYSQFDFLDPGILGFNSFYGFRARYAVMKKMEVSAGVDRMGNRRSRRINVVVGFRNQEDLRERIAPYSYRKTKEECLDLPPKIYLPPRIIQMTPEQERMYREMRHHCTTRIAGEEYATATQVIVQIMRLQQILCGEVKDENGVLHDIPTNRISELVSVLEEHSGKAIIWSPYIRSLEKISAELERVFGPGSVGRYWGATKQSERPGITRRFQEDDKLRFMVSNQQTGAKMNTWTAASLVIYYANSDNLEERMQSEDRAHRDGLKHSVSYLDFQTPGTVDVRLVKSLRKKLDLATIINGDNWREWLI